MGWLAGRAAAGVGIGAGVGLWSTAEAAIATGEAAMLATVQPAASRTTLLTVGGSAVRILRSVLASAPAAEVVARALAGVLVEARTAARLVAAW